MTHPARSHPKYIAPRGSRLRKIFGKVEYDPMDLIRFIQKNFIPLNTMMERAGMSEMDIYDRTRDVFLYYGLPFDAPPPGE